MRGAEAPVDVADAGAGGAETSTQMTAAQQATVAGSKAVRLEDVEVIAPRHSALTMAPTDSPLGVLQPQTVINLQTIQNTMAPSADYATIADIAPSVANVETNGPGLSEAKHTTIRGIDDGGYNVTFDGIPFGDYNSFTHHTTSYFPAKLLGKVVVDRGPGTASTIGNATFGGTMGLFSKDPTSQAGFIPTLSYGSWDTQLGHFEANSGLLPSLNNASLIASYQRMTTNGYRTNADLKRDTYFAKYLQPIGNGGTITLLSSLNKIDFGNPSTVTQQQIDQSGRNFGLDSDIPANHLDLLNRKYLHQDKKADFEYIGLDLPFAGDWRLANKGYTYYYDNISHEKPKVGSGAAEGTMLGSVKLNEYRTYGDTLAVSNETTVGTFKTGLWYDYTTNHRYTYGVNYDTSGADAIDLTSTALYKAAAPGGNPATLPGQPGYDYKYLLVDKNSSFQPFAEYEWKAAKDLLINAGVRYQEFTRDFNAIVNQTSGRQALVATRTDRDLTPSVSAHYALASDSAIYAQVAQGFQAPTEGNSFYVDNSNLGKITVKPELSTNYQAGAVFKQDQLNMGFDVYYVDFKNYAYSGPLDSSGDPIYYGIAKGAHYDGAEGEATFFVGQGLSFYANGSLNEAVFKGSNLKVPQVPSGTAAVGLIYNRSGFFSAFTEKYIGSWAVYDVITNPDIPGAGSSRSANSTSYWLGDLSLGYGWKFSHGLVRSVKARLQIDNVFDQKVQMLDSIGSSAAAAYTTDLFNVLPGRSYFLTVSVDF